MGKAWELVVARMQCPKCKSKFKLNVTSEVGGEVTEGFLCCNNGHRYGIHGGVADFGSVEQENGNAWSDYLQSLSMEELDKQIEDAKTDKEKGEQEKILDEVTACILAKKPQIVVDIASGRGMLLNKLAEKLPDSTVIVATDLSFEILAKDRIKFKKLFPDKHIVYLACDATEMPLQEGATDVATSFFGVANMVGIVEKGIAEASRVTQKGGYFFNCFINIKEDSKGFSAIK